jgi:hypothetical protein
MTGKQKRLLTVFLLAVTLVACIVILLLESQTNVMRRWVDDAIYDNWNHYLPCEKLPSVAEVESTIREHQQVIHQIEQVNPGFVGIEIDYPCPDHADIIVWYASHQDRLTIEEIIGNNDLFGIPYRLQNR